MEKASHKTSGTEEKESSAPSKKMRETGTEKQFSAAFIEELQNHKKEMEQMEEKLKKIQALKKKRL